MSKIWFERRQIIIGSLAVVLLMILMDIISR